MARSIGTSTLPYDDDPYIGETERAKRRKSAARGTGTGTPGIEEGQAIARPNAYDESMSRYPVTNAIAGIPNAIGQGVLATGRAMGPAIDAARGGVRQVQAALPGFDDAKQAVVNAGQKLNNVVDTGQNALAQVQRPDVAPATPPQGAASRRAVDYAGQQRADLEKMAGVERAAPAATPGADPYTQALQKVTPGTVLAAPFNQPAAAAAPAPAPYTAPPVQFPNVGAVVQPNLAAYPPSTPTPQPAPAPAAPVDPYTRAMQNVTVGSVLASPFNQQPAAPVPEPAPYTAAPVQFPNVGSVIQPATVPQQAAFQLPAPQVIAQAPQEIGPINLPVRGDAEPASSEPQPRPSSGDRPSTIPQGNMMLASRPGPGSGNEGRGGGAPLTDIDQYGPTLTRPIPKRDPNDFNTAYPAATARAPAGTLGKIQENSLSTLAKNVEQAGNEPWRQDYVRSRAEDRAGKANMMQFFSDEAQRNQRAANGPSWAEVEQAKSAARFADMSGLGRKHFAGRRDALVKEYTDANAPAAHRDYVGQQIAQTASVDQTSGLQQAQRFAEQNQPLSLAKGVQDIAAGQQGIATAQTAEQATRQKMELEHQALQIRKELADKNIDPLRKRQLESYLQSLSGKDVSDWKVIPIRRTNDLGQVNDSAIRYNERTGEWSPIEAPAAAGGALGAPPPKSGVPMKGDEKYDPVSRKWGRYDGTQWVEFEKAPPK